MESARKRSASAAHLPPFSTSTKKRQPYQPSPPRKSSPVKLTSFESRSNTSGIRDGWLTYNYMSLSMRSEPSLTMIQDSPEGHASSSTFAARPHLNRTKPEEEDNALPVISPLENPEDNRISLPPSQDRESSTESPIPSAPSTPRLSAADSPLSLQQSSYFESLTESERSTPVGVAIRKRTVRKPFQRDGFRYRVHPLKHQHEKEKKAELAAEIFKMKRATGYGQDMKTHTGFLSYRERVEQLLVATDKKMPPPQTTGPESIPPAPSLGYLQRAIQMAKKTMNTPRPAVPKFVASELLDKRNKERDAEIERRLRPKLPDSLPAGQEKVVRDSFNNRSFFAKAAREQVGPSDLSRLRPSQWLNDEIINFYGAMISERAINFEEDSAKKASGKSAEGDATSINGKDKGKGKANGDYPSIEGIGDPLKVHFFNTFFLTKLQDQGYDKGKLGKWTKKVDIFSKDLILIPCNLGNSHWTCASINFREKRIEYYDSLGMDRPGIKQMLRAYLDKEHQDKKKTSFNFDGWTDFFSEESPQQENGFDCGVFLCQTMENLSRGVPVPFDFTQANMPYLRRRMVWEITQQQLPIARI